MEHADRFQFRNIIFNFWVNKKNSREREREGKRKKVRGKQASAHPIQEIHAVYADEGRPRPLHLSDGLRMQNHFWIELLTSIVLCYPLVTRGAAGRGPRHRRLPAELPTIGRTIRRGCLDHWSGPRGSEARTHGGL